MMQWRQKKLVPRHQSSTNYSSFHFPTDQSFSTLPPINLHCPASSVSSLYLIANWLQVGAITYNKEERRFPSIYHWVNRRISIISSPTMRKYTSPITLLMLVVIVALLQTTSVLGFSSPASSLQSKHIICPSSPSSSFHTQQQQCIKKKMNNSRLYMSDGVGESAAAVPEKKGILQKVRHTSIYLSYFFVLNCEYSLWYIISL